MRQFATAVLLASSLVGCTVLPTHELSSGQRARIQSITVLDVNEPREITVLNSGGALLPFMMLGAVGGAVGGAMLEPVAESHSKLYSQRLKSLSILFASSLELPLTERLRAAGYSVASAARPANRSEDNDQRPDGNTVTTDADAILDVWFSNRFGYFSEWDSVDYKPVVVARVRMTLKSTREVVYAKTMSCGVRLPSADKHFDSDAIYRYRSFDKLMDDAERSAQGIERCEARIADDIARELTKGRSGTTAETADVPGPTTPSAATAQVAAPVAVQVSANGGQHAVAAAPPGIPAPARWSASPGIPVVLGSHAQWDNFCRPRSLPVVEVIEAPSHGQVQVQEGDFVIRAARLGSQCIGSPMHGMTVAYVPDVSFHGSDRVVYRVTENGRSLDYAADVDVK